MKALLAILLAVLCVVGCHRKAVVVDPRVEAFLREGEVLRAQSGIGVDEKAFGEQVARTRGAFDLAFREKQSPKLEKAVFDWEMALKLSRMEVRHKTFFGANVGIGFVNLMRSDRGEAALVHDWDYLEIHPYVERYLAEAATLFEEGRREIEGRGK